jgi:glutamine cyclotransferase
MNFFIKYRFFLLLLIALAIISCNGDSDDETRTVVLKVSAPKNNSQFIEGQSVSIVLDIIQPNSNAFLSVLVNGNLVYEKQGVSNEENIALDQASMNLGYNDIEIRLEGFNQTTHTERRKVVIFPNTTPDIYLPEIQKILPHNPKHYTQGYEFLEDRLFEGTGQLGESMVGEINLSTGSVLRKVSNEPNVFGEGITILNGEIFQLTWQSRICYVYNLVDLKMKKQFSYDGEGWGLANDGKVLYMSDGSSKIYVRNPENFEVIRTFDVFSNRQEYRALNELEYVDGYLYANVYQQNYILKIDPKDGRVVGLIDCDELVKIGKGSGDVLNGIAFNKKNERFYITGKYWDKVFEVILQIKSAT